MHAGLCSTTEHDHIQHRKKIKLLLWSQHHINTKKCMKSRPIKQFIVETWKRLWGLVVHLSLGKGCYNRSPLAICLWLVWATDGKQCSAWGLNGGNGRPTSHLLSPICQIQLHEQSRSGATEYTGGVILTDTTGKRKLLNYKIVAQRSRWFYLFLGESSADLWTAKGNKKKGPVL